MNHEYFVELLGYCLDGNVCMLAYEFALMGLFMIFFMGDKVLTVLSPGLFCPGHNIAIGEAKGFEYLHEKADPHIIHRDIKSINILLFDDECSGITANDWTTKCKFWGCAIITSHWTKTYRSYLISWSTKSCDLGTLILLHDIISICISSCFFSDATPRLSEDKVKQCVDPRLNAKYPPKAVAKNQLSIY
ncbi:LOW QUALITY PROTEIN: hypothetical protein V2J09_006511 [Rumex salicifolius]